MAQPDEDYADRTTIFRRDDTLRSDEKLDIGHYLVVIAGVDLGHRLRIESEPLVIGRDDRCGLALSSPDVSRRHCRGELVAGEIFATDLGSTNGTYVDGKRISETTDLDRDLEKARNYVLSLLPAPVTTGDCQTEWFIVPSAKVGGDAFGFGALDENYFVSYLIDVSGHGVGAAMLSVSILNVLRQRALPETDFHNPKEVLARLNDMCQMENHDGMFFTIWYGVYNRSKRSLTYASGGHHPAYMVSPARDSVVPLKTNCPLLGATSDFEFEEETVNVPVGATVHIFSDGVFEIVNKKGQQLGLSDFLPLLSDPALEGRSEPQRLYQTIRSNARPGPRKKISAIQWEAPRNIHGLRR
ncbi:MAG: PP2C family protein-serine/threonine phosphatase [Alphaproteobacteria bacterium]